MKKSEVLAIAGARELRKGEMKSVGGGITLSAKCSDACSFAGQPCYYLSHCLSPGVCAVQPGQGLVCIPY